MAKMKLNIVLRRLLKEKRMSALQLSRAAAVPNSTIATWLAGSAPKRPEQLSDVARVLGVGLHALLFDEPEPNAGPIVEDQGEVVLDGLYRLKLEKVILKKGNGSK